MTVRALWLFAAAFVVPHILASSNFAPSGYNNGSSNQNGPLPGLASPAVAVRTAAVNSTTVAVNSTTLAVAVSRGEHKSKTYPRIWAADMFYQTLRNFTIADNVGSSACQAQTQMYIAHLLNNTYWAVQMSDSWSRYPTGMLVSTTHQLGVYDECIDVQQPVQGQYCIPTVELHTATDTNYKVDKLYEHQTYDPAWSEILGFVDTDLKGYRHIVRFGVCIPNACTAQDLQISLQRVFNRSLFEHQLRAVVKVKPILCSTKTDVYPFDIGYYLTCSLVGLLSLVCVTSSFYHLIVILRSHNGLKSYNMPVILSSFSFVRNGRDLIKYNKNNDLNIFNGLKVVAMILVLFGHKFLYAATGPIMNGKLPEKVYKEGPYFLLTCMNLVDPFFYIAGYLMYVLMIPQFNKRGTNWCHIPIVVVYKYARTLPPYVMMMLLTTFVIPHMGNGPFWASKMWPEAEKCKKYWWANLLVVSNFIEFDQQCMIVGWYISCLLQFTIIGTIIVYIYVKNRKIGTFIIVSLLVFSLSASFISTYIHRAYGIILLTYSFLQNPSNSFEFKYLYRAFYLRGTPFYAGLLAGVVVQEMKKREIQLSKPIVYVGTVVVFVISYQIQLYGKVFYEVGRPYDIIEQSAYAMLSHCTWAFILFWITVCHFTSGYGPMEKLLNNRFVVPLGRLSYAVYLVNITVMLMIESRTRTVSTATTEQAIDGWIFSAFRTYGTGLVLYLTVEAPMGLLIKNLVYGNQKHQTDNDGAAGLPSSTTTTIVEVEPEQRVSSRL